MRAAQPEVDQDFSRSGEEATRGFGCYQRLKLQKIDQVCFDKLRLRQGRGNAKNRFLGEKYGAFRHRVHVSGEMECLKITEKLRFEPLCAGEPF